MHYNDTYIFINDRPVGLMKDTTREELEKLGFRPISARFAQAASPFAPVAKPVLAVVPKGPMPR